jgi:hypothetical protein
MEINVTTKTYTLSEEYTSLAGKQEQASVNLVINQKTKTFAVIPGDRMPSFIYESRKGIVEHNLWATVSKLTHLAITFAIDDLGLNAQPEENVDAE